jgi:hypothetical protein
VAFNASISINSRGIIILGVKRIEFGTAKLKDHGGRMGDQGKFYMYCLISYLIETWNARRGDM